MAKQYKATVFIPTWFGERYLDELLSAVFSQKTPFEFEVLLYDTSSTDSTPAIIKKFAAKHDNFRHKTISKEEFGHGKTRQAAAYDSHSEFMVYLSQDATPANEYWLHEMIKPFEISQNVVAVIGRQAPREHAFPLLKGEIRAVFAGLGSEYGTTIYRKDTFNDNNNLLDALGFYSDVNSATRREFLLEKIPYRDVPYAEDQLFGKDVIIAGYSKAYAAKAVVIHSNDITLKEYKHRMFDEVIGLRKVGTHVDIPGIRTLLKVITRGIIKDTISIIFDKSYSFKRKLYWLIVNPFFHIEKWKGVRMGAGVDLKDKDMISQHSLEEIQHSKRS